MPRNEEDDYEDDRSRRRDSDDDDQDDDRPTTSLSRRERVKEFAGKKVASGILGILLGAFGIHKFILGKGSAGGIMLAVSLVGLLSLIPGLFCILLAFPLLGTMAMSVIGLVEGIIYLTKTDEDFYQAYAVEKKSWF